MTNPISIDDVYNQTGISPTALARLGVLPQYSGNGTHYYHPVDVQQGIQRRYAVPEPLQTISHADALNHVGIPEENLLELANQYGLQPAVIDNEGTATAWSVPDVRQMYFVQNYPQETVSEDEAAASFGMRSSELKKFAEMHGYSPYTFTGKGYKPHYTKLQLKGIKSKLQEMREKHVRENMYGAPPI